MAQWQWLTSARGAYRPSFLVRVLLKASLLFVALNIAFVALNVLPALERLSIYGWLVPPRLRLPYGENSAESYNLSLTSLDAMFASHAVVQPKAADEFRILVFGDSGTWGFLLRPDETLAGQINAGDFRTADGRRIRAYNLGYPEMSLTKDFLLMDAAMRYQPDFILWLVTLESFAPQRQASPALVRANRDTMRRLEAEYGLRASGVGSSDGSERYWDATIIGGRRRLADWLRFQLYGFSWAATRIDQAYPADYTLRTSDFEPDITWHEFDTPFDFTTEDIAFYALSAGISRAGDVPLLIVNEPMFVSSGQNSDLRYNFFYPRWAYDRYRSLLATFSTGEDVPLLDVWDRIAPDEFTDSPVHMTPDGVAELVRLVMPEIPRLTQ